MKKIMAVLIFAALSWGTVTQVTGEFYICNLLTERSTSWPQNVLVKVIEDGQTYRLIGTSFIPFATITIPVMTQSSGGGAMASHGNEYHTSTFITLANPVFDTVVKITDAEYIDALAKRHSNSLDHDGAAQNTAIAGKCASNDSRLSDARTPLAHSHAIADVTSLQTTLDGKSATSHTHGGTYEPVLGNPGTNGYVLSSTTAGVRSWVAAAGGAAWGSITGTLTNQTDLNTALNAKQATLTRNTGLITYAALANGTVAMAFGTNSTVKVTPTATASFTTTVPAAGCESNLIILTSGTTSYTITFSTGFKSTGTLATGTVTAKVFVLHFVSDGTTVTETGRTIAQ